MKKEEKMYEIILGAINYRKNMLVEKINQNYLPQNLKDEYQEKLEKLLELRDLFFL